MHASILPTFLFEILSIISSPMSTEAEIYNNICMDENIL